MTSSVTGTVDTKAGREADAQLRLAVQELWIAGMALSVAAKWPWWYRSRYYLEENARRVSTILDQLGELQKAVDVLSVHGDRYIKSSRLTMEGAWKEAGLRIDRRRE